MFGSIGFPEILFILAVALLIFGPKRLPEVGRTLGKGLREFRKASNELRRSVEDEIRLDDPPVQAPVPAAVPAASTEAAPAGTVAGGEAERESSDGSAPDADGADTSDEASDSDSVPASSS